ncbi:hypothetical protein BpHYR1_046612, partial [Brachionus plicatilis]
MGKDGEKTRLPATSTELTFLENIPTANQSRNTSLEDSSNNVTFRLGLNEDNIPNRSVGSDITKIKTIFTKNYHSISLSDIRLFTFFMCLIVMLTNALTVGYRNS